MYLLRKKKGTQKLYSSLSCFSTAHKLTFPVIFPKILRKCKTLVLLLHKVHGLETKTVLASILEECHLKKSQLCCRSVTGIKTSTPIQTHNILKGNIKTWGLKQGKTLLLAPTAPNDHAIGRPFKCQSHRRKG